MSYANGIRGGVVGGLAGGALFGLLMWMMGMLPMIGGMIGVSTEPAGFAVHMMMSAAIGAGFGVWATRAGVRGGRTVPAAIGYGAMWWVLGPLTLMPWLTGMGFAANWSASGVSASLPSLGGHLLFGAVLGFTFERLEASRPSGSTGLASRAV